jgi:hypothetical protein
MQSLPNTTSPSTGALAAPAHSFATFGASLLLLPLGHLAILR